MSIRTCLDNWLSENVRVDAPGLRQSSGCVAVPSAAENDTDPDPPPKSPVAVTVNTTRPPSATEPPEIVTSAVVGANVPHNGPAPSTGWRNVAAAGHNTQTARMREIRAAWSCGPRTGSGGAGPDSNEPDTTRDHTQPGMRLPSALGCRSATLWDVCATLVGNGA